MLEKIRRIMEGPGLPKVVDSALREVKLSLAVDLFCQANAIDTARYRQREKGDTLGIDELTTIIEEALSWFPPVLKSLAIRIATEENPSTHLNDYLPESTLNDVDIKQATEMFADVVRLATNEQENTDAFEVMLRYAGFMIPDERECSPTQILWAICLYYALTMNGASLHLDSVVDLALTRVSRMATGLMFMWRKEGAKHVRTQKSATAKGERKAARARKAVALYREINREDLSLYGAAHLVHKRWGKKYGEKPPDVRSIYKYIKESEKTDD